MESGGGSAHAECAKENPIGRRILITNDDGIGAAGIRKLAAIARRFGEVTAVAPDAQRSEASHYRIFSRPLILKEYDLCRRWMGRTSRMR